uniref:Uncharacterized protein n=1 Tax=Anguilla anguilla TaxID=7936 RepID=A0A0E9RGJ4_ANGAN
MGSTSEPGSIIFCSKDALRCVLGHMSNRMYNGDSSEWSSPTRQLDHSSLAAGRLAPFAVRVNGSRASQPWSFSTLAPLWWSNLPVPVRTTPSLPIFCLGLRLISSDYTWIN